jgi:hypothetical protein
MNTRILASGPIAFAFLFLSGAAQADVAADVCPPMGFLNTTNHVQNSSFEKADHGGVNHSAAKNWFLHGDNEGDPVTSSLIATTVPHGTDPGEGSKMIHIDAKGNESGVYQILPVELVHSKLMFSVWVNVKKGHVAIQLGSFVGGPAGWSTKHNQWEELHICSNGNPDAPAQDSIFIVNEDPAGGHFDIDRVEVRETQ